MIVESYLVSKKLVKQMRKCFKTWEDPRLEFNSSKYDGIEMVVVNKGDIWSPDFSNLDR